MHLGKRQAVVSVAGGEGKVGGGGYRPGGRGLEYGKVQATASTGGQHQKAPSGF